jgi:hypothetical protein
MLLSLNGAPRAKELVATIEAASISMRPEKESDEYINDDRLRE